MIEAVFRNHLGFLAFAIAVTLLGGLGVGVVAARRGERRSAVFSGLWASSAIGPVLLTTWNGGGNGDAVCVVNPEVGAAFATTQGQLNVLLFAPFGLFALLATGRPLLSCLLGLLFTAGVETAQAAVPFVSRLCDTDDLATNAVGVVGGVGVGALVSRWVAPRRRLGGGAVRRVGLGGGVAALLLLCVWGTVIEPVRAVLPTEVPAASAEQVRALDLALREAFGDAYGVDEAMFLHSMEGPDLVSAPLPGGYAELSWPDRERFTVHLTPTSRSEGGSEPYGIPGVSRPVRTAGQAVRVATGFARRYAPWAVRDAEVSVRAVDAAEEELGWAVGWRRRHGTTLMPMRLDVVIEPSSRLTDLSARRVEDPVLPPVEITEAEAWRRFASRHRLAPGQVEREEAVSLAERGEHGWRVRWRLTARQGDLVLSAAVDATTGVVTDAAVRPASDDSQPPGALPAQQPW